MAFSSKVKKIIAREFLVLILCITVAGITFLTTTAINYNQKTKRSELHQKIKTLEHVSDSLKKIYYSKFNAKKEFDDLTEFSNHNNIVIEDFKKSKKKIFGINADGKKVWSEGLLYLKRKLHDHQDIPYKYGKDISPNESDLHKALAKVVKSNVPNKAHQNEGYVWFLSLLKRNVDKLYNPLIKCSSCNNYVPKNKSVFKLIINEELESFKYYEKEFLDLNFITTIELSKKDSLSFYWENKFHPILKYDLESNYGIDTPDSLKAFIAQNIITKKDINNKSEAIVIDNKIKELSSKIYSKKGLNKKLSTLNAFRLSLLILFGIRYLVMSILWSVRTLKR